jgi:hypothetical protein
LSGGSSPFFRKKSDDCIEIDDSVEILDGMDISHSSTLKTVIFSSNSHLREINSFQQ